MIVIYATQRLLAQQENHQWIKPVLQQQKMKAKPPRSDLVKPGVYSGSPQSIAQELRRVHKELAPCIAALNFYYNKFGKRITADQKRKRTDVRKALRKLFNADKPEAKKKTQQTKTKPKPVGHEPVGTKPIGTNPIGAK